MSAKLLHSFAEIAGGDPIAAAIGAARDALLKQQRDDGHWVFELEADATIPAEYVLLVHYLAETPNLELERKIGVYRGGDGIAVFDFGKTLEQFGAQHESLREGPIIHWHG